MATKPPTRLARDFMVTKLVTKRPAADGFTSLGVLLTHGILGASVFTRSNPLRTARVLVAAASHRETAQPDLSAIVAQNESRFS